MNKQHKKNSKWIYVVVGMALVTVLLMWKQTRVSQVAALPPPVKETANYIDHSNGTITDKTTGLMWKKCTEGLSGYLCTEGQALEVTWQEAFDLPKQLNLAGGFAGYTDWRVPSALELTTLVDFDHYLPAIDTQIFPAKPCCKFTEGRTPWPGGGIASRTIYPTYYWSSSIMDSPTGKGCFPWSFELDGGELNVSHKDDNTVCTNPTIYVILVRGTSLKRQFQLNGDGTVTESRFGLMWKVCPEGTHGAKCEEGELLEMIRKEAFEYPEQYNRQGGFAGYDDWRIPTIKELISIIDFRTQDETIADVVFPVKGKSFWSTTPWSGGTDYAWLGSIWGYSHRPIKVYEEYKRHLRLVRLNK